MFPLFLLNRPCNESRVIRSRKERPNCVTALPEFFLVYQVSLNNNLYRRNVEIVVVSSFYMMDLKMININLF